MSSTAVDWSAFYARLHAFVAARVRGASDTDDLVQKTLERAITRSDGVEIDNAAGWLFGIARNAIADHYRAQARALSREADALDNEPALGGSDHERAAVIACMEPLLQSLPVETARLLRWADMEERSIQSIADELAITLTAAKSRVQRARKDFVQVTRECCAITVDARGRVVELSPRSRASASEHDSTPSCCGGERECGS